ncbi:unnamed protein product [Rotaria sp. Silwood1]|nr:unnamed protein product [Rotaria sp. Silwood1]
MNDEFDSTSMINNEKGISAAKLVNQLYFFPIRYMLNMDDITYLLPLCKHGDLHLRGAPANLLVTLIQTTIHLLTLSSLSNSCINSFINQCSLISTDSQDSSSHAFTIIGIELLEDSIQHSTSSCVLAKVGCLEDIYVLSNVLRSTTIRSFFHNQYDKLRLFINFFKHPFILHYLNNLIFSKNDKGSSTTSNTDKDKKVNRTQLAIVSSSSAERKSSNVSSQVSSNNSLANIHTISIQQPIIYFIWFTLCINILFCCIAEYLVMLSHDTLHSKQVIKVQDLIKHYDSLLASGHEPETHVIVNSVGIEDDKWNRLSRQSVDVLLVHLQSQDQSLLDIYSTQLTLFDVVLSIELRSIDPFVIAFRALNDILSSVNGTRDETFSVTLLRILHDVILRILTNTRQLRGQIDMTLVSLASDYLYVLMYIMD